MQPLSTNQENGAVPNQDSTTHNRRTAADHHYNTTPKQNHTPCRPQPLRRTSHQPRSNRPRKFHLDFTNRPHTTDQQPPSHHLHSSSLPMSANKTTIHIHAHHHQHHNSHHHLSHITHEQLSQHLKWRNSNTLPWKGTSTSKLTDTPTGINYAFCKPSTKRTEPAAKAESVPSTEATNRYHQAHTFSK